MASNQTSLTLVAVCIMAMLASSGFVSGKVVAKTHHQQRQMGCAAGLAICALPVLFIDKDTVRTQVQQEGFDQLCETFLAVKSCIDLVYAQCKEEGEEIPAELEQGINLLGEASNFICVEELNSINADRECLFSNELEEVVQGNCGTSQPSGEVCSLSEDLECSLTQYEALCDGRSLANKFRAFAAKVERQSNCNNIKARSVTWRQLASLFRR